MIIDTVSVARSRRRRRYSQWLANYWLVTLAFIFTVLRSLRAGTDSYYDFLNVKWLMGWQLVNGDFDLAGIASSRKWGPPFLDIWHAVLANLDVWWVPALVHGSFHAAIAPSVFFAARRLSPNLHNLLHQSVSAVAVGVPLVAMQVGTTSGHLYAALPLVWSLGMLLGLRSELDRNLGTSESMSFQYQNRSWALAGAVLALSPLLKPSALASIPAHFVGIPLITGSLAGLASFTLGFASLYLTVSLIWSTVVAVGSDEGLLSVRTPGFPLEGLGLWLSSIMVLLLLYRMVTANRPKNSLIGKLLIFKELRYLWMLLILLATSLGAFFLRSAAYDGRWFVDNWSEFRQRLLHTGDLQFGFDTLDLEMPYFDVSIPLASILLIAGFLLLLASSSHKIPDRIDVVVGTVVFCTLPFIFNIYATGYTRYATQAVPLVGIAGVALFSTSKSRIINSLFCVTFLAIWSLPIWSGSRSSNGSDRFAQEAPSGGFFSSYVEADDVDLLSALIPEGATVFVVGSRISFVAAQMGREDLSWEFRRPKRHELVGFSEPIMVLSNPAETDGLRKYEEQGFNLSECGVLRFDRASFGLCDATLDRD